MKKHYLVKLHLIMADIEKYTVTKVLANSKKEACKIALECECHYEPDFEGFPDFDGVWDGVDYQYIISDCKELTEIEYKILSMFI